LAYASAGKGPALLLIHGFPLNRSLWRRQLAAFSGWQCIAPDLRGLGRSPGLEPVRGIGQYADDMAALLDALKIRRAVVCGLSMGGYVALEFLRRYPERLLALGLFSTRAEPDSADGKKARDAAITLVEQDGLPALADSMLPKLLGPASATGLIRTVRKMIVGSPPAGIIAALRAMRDREDSRPLLGGIRVPTLVLAGRDDTLFPAGTAETLAEAIPGALLTMVERAGHLAPLEQPTPVNKALTAFLGSLS
jgi:pimeloyl-ACP methyl ester carboxylesterase